MVYKCTVCGKIYIRPSWARKHSMFNAGHYVEEIKEEPKIDLATLMNRLNKFTLKVSIMEKKGIIKRINDLEEKVMEILKNGITISNKPSDSAWDNWTPNNRPNSSKPLSNEQKNHFEVMKELKEIVKGINSLREILTPAPDISENYVNIYDSSELQLNESESVLQEILP